MSTPLATLWPGEHTPSEGRVYNALRRDGIHDVESLTRVTAGHLLGLYGFGPGCLEAVQRALAAHGLALSGEEVQT